MQQEDQLNQEDILISKNSGENGWNLLPYLKIQKWENFVQVKERVYLESVKEFYENTDDSLRWTKSIVGGTSLYCTQEFISEALEIPTTEKQVFGDEWMTMMNTIEERVRKQVLKEGT